MSKLLFRVDIMLTVGVFVCDGIYASFIVATIVNVYGECISILSEQNRNNLKLLLIKNRMCYEKQNIPDANVE